MKKSILSLTFTMMIFISSMLPINKANALVGIIIKQKTMQTIGVIASGLGGISLVSSISTAVITKTFSGATLKFILIAGGGGTILGTLGFLILDDKENMTLKFSAIENGSDDFKNYNVEDIEIYNSEIEELNAVISTIDLEITDETNVKVVNSLWSEYAQSLHPVTIKIAQDKAKRFIKALQ